MFKEIGGADFALAENLYYRLKKQKKKEIAAKQNLTGENKDSQLKLNPNSGNKELIMDEKVTTNIHKFLDEKFGQWDDAGSSGSESDAEASTTCEALDAADSSDEASSPCEAGDAADGSDEASSPCEAGDAADDSDDSDITQIRLKSKSTNSKVAHKKATRDESSILGIEKRKKMLSLSEKKLNISKQKLSSPKQNLSTSEEEQCPSNKKSKVYNNSSQLPDKDSRKNSNSRVKSQIEKPCISIPTLKKVTGAEVKQIDLTKLLSKSSTIQLGSSNKELALKPEDEILCDLPKKLSFTKKLKLQELSENVNVSKDYILRGNVSDEEQPEGATVLERGGNNNEIIKWNTSSDGRGFPNGRHGLGRGSNRGAPSGRGSGRGSSRGGGTDRGAPRGRAADRIVASGRGAFYGSPKGRGNLFNYSGESREPTMTGIDQGIYLNG